MYKLILFALINFMSLTALKGFAANEATKLLKLKDLSLSYPAQRWTLKKGEKKYLALLIGSNDENKIQISSVTDGTSAGQLALADKPHWTAMPDSQMIFEKSIKIGRNGKTPALTYMVSYLSSGPSYPEYRYYWQCVYFGSAGHVYKIGLHAIAKDYTSAASDLEHILATIEQPVKR